MIYAPIFIARWDRSIVAISKVQGLLALKNTTYLQERQLYTISGLTFIVILALLSLISTLKPWTKLDRVKMRDRNPSSS